MGTSSPELAALDAALRAAVGAPGSAATRTNDRAGVARIAAAGVMVMSRKYSGYVTF